MTVTIVYKDKIKELLSRCIGRSWAQKIKASARVLLSPKEDKSKWLNNLLHEYAKGGWLTGKDAEMLKNALGSPELDEIIAELFV